MAPWRIVFMGTPEFAVPSLAALLAGADPVVGVFTQPDKPAGRGMKMQVSPIGQVAQQRGIPLFRPRRLREADALASLRDLQPDLVVVVAYGQILSPETLAIPVQGCINVHASLLPRWRGAAPIHRALLAGDAVTGITIMRMDAGLDTGPVLARREHPIRPETTGGHLHDSLSRLGGGLLRETVADLKAGRIVPKPQPEEGVTCAAKLTRADALIDWTRPAEEVIRVVRALSPWPGAFTHLEGAELKVFDARPLCGHCRVDGQPGAVVRVTEEGLEVACGAGGVMLTELQSPGKRRLSAAAWLRGRSISSGIFLQKEPGAPI
ncbi:MAG: methionyl-tRNA formyltransferase [Magnetococcales bacterium]|nr:methionyl-tRNA formyltransferase [Magnetococcales bacterium]